MMDYITRALSELDRAAAHAEYDSQAQLQRAEVELATLLPGLQELAADERARMRAVVDYSTTYTLFGFSVRLASAAIRGGDARLLLSGAIALTLDDDELDPRDLYRALAVIRDASARVGADGDAIIANAAKCASPRRAAFMEGYLEAPDYMRSITSMGFELADGTMGPYYRGTGF